MKTKFLILILIISTVSGIAQVQIPLPTLIQQTWQNAELTVLISYDLHISDGQDYNQAKNRITPIADYNIFNPKKLDTDQWIEAVRGMGAKLAILTVTHETGFALYQSDVNPYCMKALKYQDGKGDIVRDFVASCRKFGVLPGLYIGIRWNSFLGVHDFMVQGDSSQFSQNRQAYYNRQCEKMTEELMSRYGELAMVWFDGGAHGPELGGPDILPIVEKYQKNIIFYHNTQRADIRWGGSESGTVSYPCWGTYPYPYSHSTNQKEIFKDNFRLLKEGDPNGKYYMPAMSDAPLRGYNSRHEWFWEPGDEAHIFPLENLMEMYYRSVGRNSTLILGLTPDNEGLMPEPDVKRIREFGNEIKRRFSNPIASSRGTGDIINLKLQKKQKVNQLVLMEDISKGERVRKFVFEGRKQNGWQIIFEGSCIGHKFIHLFNSVEVSAVRLKILESKGEPQLSNISVFYIE